MRKVVIATFLSLDGVMQAPGGPAEDPSGAFTHGGWTVPHWDEAMGEVMGKVFAEPFALLLGRRTYDIFAAHWPRMENDPMAEKLNAAIKYVATTSKQPLTWQNSVALRGDAAAEVKKLKQQDGPNLLIQGSGDFVQTLLANDLIDEFTLLTFPVVLGRGKRLFGAGSMPMGFKLAESKMSTTGVAMNKYVRSGGVSTGSFALDDSAQS